ncbi:MAG TPA: T9SS type A sorting domain-containing protein [Candidatus Marinimicrobia bacterium]|nr:T9SS type A sorting domain-containing protein [Candidatus Neomarinimicrobiota bacterium]
MKKVTVLLMSVFLVSALMADIFPRIGYVEIEDALTVNTGGIGNMIAGVDVDGDGKLEIYMVNDNWNDTASELVPRIYKYEQDDDGEWALVWSAEAPTSLVEAQNTWPILKLTDLDKDGKMELLWGVVNNLGTNQNPARFLVYEHDEGDNFGVYNDGVWEPNASWSITEDDGMNIRPMSCVVSDIDGDGTDEIIFAGRTTGMRIGIASVDNIPDNGDGSETWTLEYSLAGGDDGYTGDNKWDVAVLGSNAYFFCEKEISKVSWDGSAYVYTALDPLPGGISFDAVQVCDLDGNGTLEMVTGEYAYGESVRNIWLLEEDGDSLKRTQLFDINGEDMLNGGRLSGGAMGDIDGDGYMDFVFGSRYSGPPNGMIFWVAYNGGAIDDPANWEVSIIDSAYAYEDLPSGGIWNVIEIANIDDDKGMEVLYTSSTSIPYSEEYASVNISAPVIILDSPNTDPVSVSPISGPSAFQLHQNHPNPFNPTTSISFTLDIASDVLINVYDMSGRKVTTLTKDSYSAGTHSVVWDGLDNDGNPVASGVYTYQMRAGNKILAKRMVFMK